MHLFLNIWSILSGIHHLLIHPTAIIFYTTFLPFKTEMVDGFAVLSHLQIYVVAFISSPDLGHLLHRIGQAAMYSTFATLSLSIVLLISIYTKYCVDRIKLHYTTER